MTEQTGANAPDDLQALRDNLKEKWGHLEARRDELLATAASWGDSIGDDAEKATQLTDFVGQLVALMKAAENARVAEKEPFLLSERAVDGFFNTGIAAKLKPAVTRLKDGVLARYLRAKAEREKREAQEAAERARLEAERLRLEAEAKARAEEEAERARLAALAPPPPPVDPAVYPGEEPPAPQPAPAPAAAAPSPAAQAAQRAAEAAHAEATRLESKASGKASAFGKSRGDFGALGTLRSEKTCALQNRDLIDWQQLGPHITDEALAQAGRAWVKANPQAKLGLHTLPGFDIFERDLTQVRR